jgi:hypothetical protein
MSFPNDYVINFLKFIKKFIRFRSEFSKLSSSQYFERIDAFAYGLSKFFYFIFGNLCLVIGWVIVHPKVGSGEFQVLFLVLVSMIIGFWWLGVRLFSLILRMILIWKFPAGNSK